MVCVIIPCSAIVGFVRWSPHCCKAKERDRERERERERERSEVPSLRFYESTTTSKRSIHISAHVSVQAALMSPPHNSNVGLPQPAGRHTLVHTSTARHVRETTVYGRYVHHGRGSASQRGRSVAAKSMLSSSVRAFRGRGASSSGARGDRLSARCSSRAATGQAAASETGVCVCARRALPPRTDTTRAVARAARVH